MSYISLTIMGCLFTLSEVAKVIMHVDHGYTLICAVLCFVGASIVKAINGAKS